MAKVIFCTTDNIRLSFSDSLAECRGGKFTVKDYDGVPLFNPADLDPVLIAGSVGAGFFVLTVLFVAIHGLSVLIKSIR